MLAIAGWRPERFGVEQGALGRP